MAAAIKKRMPWTKSTGPKTAEGKRKVSRNGSKRPQEVAPQAQQEAKPLPEQPEQKPAEQAQGESGNANAGIELHTQESPGHGGFFAGPTPRLSLYHVMGRKRS